MGYLIKKGKMMCEECENSKQMSCDTRSECFCEEETVCLNGGECEGCPDNERCNGEAEAES